MRVFNDGKVSRGGWKEGFLKQKESALREGGQEKSGYVLLSVNLQRNLGKFGFQSVRELACRCPCPCNSPCDPTCDSIRCDPVDPPPCPEDARSKVDSLSVGVVCDKICDSILCDAIVCDNNWCDSVCSSVCDEVCDQVCDSIVEAREV